MKTIPQLTKKINEIIESLNDKNRDKKKDKRLKAKLTLFRQCVAYLETNPTKEIMNSEIEKLNSKLEIFENVFNTWCEYHPDKILNAIDPKKVYNKEMRVAFFKKQLNTLKFLNS